MDRNLLLILRYLNIFFQTFEQVSREGGWSTLNVGNISSSWGKTPNKMYKHLLTFCVKVKICFRNYTLSQNNHQD